jgi:alpha-glucosidase
MRNLIDGYDDRMMVGEIYLPNRELMAYYGTRLDECHLPFNFQLISARWDAETVRSLVDRYAAALPSGAWPNWVLGNHDQRRLATRVGCEQARVALMLLLTLRGTPTCYYGDELGMEDVPIPRAAMKDPQALNQPAIAEQMSRDPARTPMQWDDGPNAGFAPPGTASWLPVAADYATRNVAVQSQDPRSMLSFFRALTALRQGTPALVAGDYASVDTLWPEIFAYTRTLSGERYMVVLNFGAERRRLDFTALGKHSEILLSTRMERHGAGVALQSLTTEPNEGLVLRLW